MVLPPLTYNLYPRYLHHLQSRNQMRYSDFCLIWKVQIVLTKFWRYLFATWIPSKNELWWHPFEIQARPANYVDMFKLDINKGMPSSYLRARFLHLSIKSRMGSPVILLVSYKCWHHYLSLIFIISREKSSFKITSWFDGAYC